MKKWNEIHKKAQKLMDEGMTLMKKGIKEAEFLSGATLDATRLHLQKKKDQLEAERAFHKLGKVCFESFDSKNGRINLTASMKGLIDDINNLKDDEKQLNYKISKLTVTDRSKSKNR